MSDLNTVDLPQALRDLPALAPAADRLQAVLSATPSKPLLARKWSASWLALSALAASIALMALWLHGPTRDARKPALLAEQIASSDSRELAQLIAQSQRLEQRWQQSHQRRASFSELSARQLATLSVAQLDGEISELANLESSPAAQMQKQKTLWRERVAVLDAVWQGQYRPALYVVD